VAGRDDAVNRRPVVDARPPGERTWHRPSISRFILTARSKQVVLLAEPVLLASRSNPRFVNRRAGPISTLRPSGRAALGSCRHLDSSTKSSAIRLRPVRLTSAPETFVLSIAVEKSSSRSQWRNGFSNRPWRKA